MSSPAFVLILVAILASACSAFAGHAPCQLASAESDTDVEDVRVGRPPRVLVEVLLVEIANVDLGLLGEKSFPEIASSPNIRVLTNPHILADDHQLALISIPLPAAEDPNRPRGPDQEQRWTVKADVLAHDELRLELGVATIEGDGAVAEPMRVAFAMADRQRAIVKTVFPVREGHSIVAVVRPDILRNEGDLRRVYERKMRERAHASGRLGEASGAGAKGFPRAGP